MQTFSDMIGQDNIIQHFQNALRSGAVSHACLLVGDEGSGKETIARLYAQALQCENVEEKNGFLEPCGSCISCIQAQAADQPDIITVTHEKPLTIGVDDIRQLRQDIQIRPYASKYKIYIIPDAQLMNTQAQNALLKILEEPPSYAVILLLAVSAGGFLPTILSRCITLRFRTVPEEKIVTWLTEKYGIDEEKAVNAARFSGGSPGKALRLSGSELFLNFRRESVKLLKNLEKTDIYTITDAITSLLPDQAKAKKEPKARKTDAGSDASAPETIEAVPDVSDFLELLRMWFRDIAVMRSTGSGDNLIFMEEIQYISTAADKVDDAGLERIFNAIRTAEDRIRARGSRDLILQVMMLAIRDSLRSAQTRDS